MKLTDEQIDKLLKEYRYDEVIKNLEGVIKTSEATFHDYYAFIEAVSQMLYRQYYPLAFDCFMLANLTKSNSELLKKIYLRMEPIIKALGFAYFDDNNSNKIRRDFYLKARFMLYAMSNRYADALKTISELIKNFGSPMAYFQRSKIYIMQRQYKLALQDLDKAIELSANNALFYYYRATLKEKMNDVQGAFADIDNAINYDSENYSYYLHRGAMQESQGNYKNAIDDFKKSVGLKPDYIEAYTELAWCHYKMNKLSEAISYINHALQIDGKNTGCYYVRGTIYNAADKFEEARNDLSMAVQTDNQSDKMWSSKLFYQKAWAEFKLKNYKQAQSDIFNAIKLAPRIVNYYILAMDIEFFGLEDYIAAKTYCKEILKLEPDNQRALQAQHEIDEKIL